MKVSRYEDVISKVNESLNEKKDYLTVQEALDESIIKFTEIDREKVSQDILDGLDQSENVYSEVKYDEKRNCIKLTDSEGGAYSIYIESS